jgi:hypothetical protein
MSEEAAATAHNEATNRPLIEIKPEIRNGPELLPIRDTHNRPPDERTRILRGHAPNPLPIDRPGNGVRADVIFHPARHMPGRAPRRAALVLLVPFVLALA